MRLMNASDQAKIKGLRALLDRAANALENTYDACDYPADGTSNAEIVAAEIRAALKDSP